MIFNVDPGSLKIHDGEYGRLEDLYSVYWDDLIHMCREMQQVRIDMLHRGYSADFSDREAELLYLLIRDTRPSVVVEISPCHGYSTNYILAALTDNNKGRLLSYEICAQANGFPIDEVILSNLSDRVDKSRLELVVGDVTRASIPSHDFLFIDSNHESWFAAWYFSHLINIPKVVFVHDVLIRAPFPNALLPKAGFLGSREQYYVLQALHGNRQLLFSVADFAGRLNDKLKASIPARHEIVDSDRSVIFAGHEQTNFAMTVHRAMGQIHEGLLNAIIGDRTAAWACYRNFARESNQVFVRMQASSILPCMGYRHSVFPGMFEDLAIDYETVTISELVAVLELALSSGNINQLKHALKHARYSPIDEQVRRHIVETYKEISNLRAHGFRQTARGLYHRLSST